MYVREVGSGPTVVVLHGSPSPAEDWYPLARTLATTYRVLLPDLPGYGRSPDPIDASMERVGDMVAARLAELGAREVHAIVGYSAGAYRALDLVSRGAVRAKLVYALAGVACFDGPAREQRAALADRIDREPGVLATAELRTRMIERMLSPAWRQSHPDDAERVAAWPTIARANALARELRALAASRDLLPALKTLPARVVARVGTLDVACPLSCSEAIVAHAPNARLELVAGCGHALLMEDAAATIASVQRALAEAA